MTCENQRTIMMLKLRKIKAVRYKKFMCNANINKSIYILMESNNIKDLLSIKLLKNLKKINNLNADICIMNIIENKPYSICIYNSLYEYKISSI